MNGVLPTALLLSFTAALAFAAWADDATTTPAPKIVRKQIPEPPSDLLIKQRVQEARQAGGPAQDIPQGILTWDTDSKEQTVPKGTTATHFVFTATNVSSHAVTLLKATASCGCTVAKLPDNPTISPGGTGRIEVTMDLRGKYSKVIKTVTVSTDQGVKVLNVATYLPPPTLREIRQDIAQTDRQAVFKGDCTKCHVDPAVGKTGQVLFASACGICHEASPRAAMVPDLRTLPHETGGAFWKDAVAHGKPGTMMPAFAQSEGGILTDAQVTSLVEYLSKTIPETPQSASR